MGLDFRGSRAHWSYSGFHSFRCRLAQEIGMNLDAMPGFTYFSGVMSDARWEDYDDPILPLLNHSDCDGELAPEVCQVVAPRLREIVTGWPDDYDRRQAFMLADTMERCGQEGRPLVFC